MQLHENECIEIKLLNCDNPECLRLVLEFLYTDRIVSLEGREKELTTLKLMIDVYKLSSQFMIHKLTKMCEILIESSITCSNVLNLLYYIDSLNLLTLKEACMSFLIKDTNFNQVIMLSEFESLESSLMVEIIRRRQATTPKKTPVEPPDEKCKQPFSFSLFFAEKIIVLFFITRNNNRFHVGARLGELLAQGDWQRVRGHSLAAERESAAHFGAQVHSGGALSLLRGLLQVVYAKRQAHYVDHRRHDSAAADVLVSAALHLLRRCEHVARGRAVLVHGESLFSVQQHALARLLQANPRVERVQEQCL